jgi:hypothetical protein
MANHVYLMFLCANVQQLFEINKYNHYYFYIIIKKK